jgi:uncharacterized protein YyaL (SSP411 family)
MLEIQHTNRLIHEISPYLRGHAHNPVDWYPWGDEAFQKAKVEDKPILLSCGYSACHWCHVMERESFENPEIASLMNQYFVNIKVDREERPDIDQIYQEAVQTMTGRGGWPLTIFLNHDGKPFFGGTYFPPVPKYGRNSFPQFLEILHQKWVEEREQVQNAGAELCQYLYADSVKPNLKPMVPAGDLLAVATQKLLRYFDSEYGGFDHAPKFPNPPLLQLLLTTGTLNRQTEAIEAALFSLEQMGRGGIYDQLGGGFHRYSTDRYWLTPHFEKMLYDNAQLLKLFSVGYQLRPAAEFKKVVYETADYLRREMTDPEGGLYATQDADSEGVEGKYYIWSIAEIKEWLTNEEAEAIIDHFGLTEQGNFEGENILFRSIHKGGKTKAYSEALLDQAKAKLLKLRETRVKPFRDTKIITGWNALAISGFAYAYQVFQREEDYHSARNALEFILQRSRLTTGQLARIYKEEARVGAMLDDYAFLVQALLDMYETDFNPDWLERCIQLTGEVKKRFGSEAGVYYLSSATGEKLVVRPVSRYDQAIPSGVSVQLSNLQRLASLTGQPEFQIEAERIFRAYQAGLAEGAWSTAGILTQIDIYQHGRCEFVFLSATHEQPELLRKLRQKYLPNRIVAWSKANSEKLTHHPARELFAGRKLLSGEPTCYICSKQQCQSPVTQWGDLESHLDLKL